MGIMQERVQTDMRYFRAQVSINITETASVFNTVQKMVEQGKSVEDIMKTVESQGSSYQQLNMTQEQMQEQVKELVRNHACQKYFTQLVEVTKRLDLAGLEYKGGTNLSDDAVNIITSDDQV